MIPEDSFLMGFPDRKGLKGGEGSEKYSVNYDIISGGWMPAGPAQTQAYIRRGRTGHQLYLAKLHSFLRTWDKLGEMKLMPTGIQRIC